MTTADLLPLIAAAVLKGAAFGALFAWLFPPFNRYVTRILGRATEPMPIAAPSSGRRAFYGLALLSGSGFALLDLIATVSEAAGLPGLLTWVVAALFALSAWGTVLIIQASPRKQPAPPQ